MKAEVAKIITKKVIGNTLILLVILTLVIAATGIPLDFNIYSYNGVHTPNMGREEIVESIKGKFNVFITGEFLNIKIQRESATQLLWKASKRSMVILIFGTLLAMAIGIPKGIIDSRKRNRSGTLKLLQSLIPLSLPDIFTIALVQLGTIYLFKNEITIFGLGPIPPFGDESFLHFIFPIISISILPAAYISRITANVIESCFEKPYILAARGKGCSRIQIIKNHMAKSISFGILSGLPTVLGIMFSSLIIVERLFYIKGIGYYLLFFYSTTLVPQYEAGVAFTFFIVALALFYYFVFMIINILKDVILPQIKS